MHFLQSFLIFFTGIPELPRDDAEGALQPAAEVVQPLQRKPRGAVADTAEGAGKHAFSITETIHTG